MILKEKTFVFQNNAEQSKLTALNNNSKNAPNTHPFFGIEHEKHAKVLCVHWLFTSEVYCKILAWLSMNGDHTKRQNWTAYTSCNLHWGWLAKKNFVISQMERISNQGLLQAVLNMIS